RTSAGKGGEWPRSHRSHTARPCEGRSPTGLCAAPRTVASDRRNRRRQTTVTGDAQQEQAHTCCRCCPCGKHPRESAADRRERLWDVCDVAWFMGAGHTTVEGYRTEPDFPAPMVLPGRLVRWLPEQLRTWAEGRVAASAPASPVPAATRSR